MKSIVTVVMMVIGLLYLLMKAVEAPGGGPEKKAAVIAAFRDLVGILPIPAWAKALFLLEPVVGTVIDLMIGLLNKSGWFEEDAPDPLPAPSG
jgi:hypothetical protein